MGIVAREWCDGRTRLLERRRVDDVAFLLQALERAAHGRATDAEARGDIGLDDARARSEAALDDEGAQSLVDLLRSCALARGDRGAHYLYRNLYTNTPLFTNRSTRSARVFA